LKYEFMNDKSKADKNTDLALTGMGALAKLIGIAIPPVNALTIITDNIKDRRNRKRLDRLIKLIQCLDRRLTQVEDKIPETPDLDLFDEIIAKAVSEEDEDKTELYAALVQYWIEHTLVSYEVRLLGSAIRELTVDEMKCFYEFIVTGSPKRIRIIPELLQEVFWNRIVSLGLLGGVGHFDQINSVNVTKLGRKLFEIYQLSGKAK